MLVWPDVLAQPITSGGVNATSAVTSLGSATTAGNTLLILATTYGATGITTPTGYTRLSALPTTTAKVYLFRKTTVAAGSDTLPTLATGASTQKTAWYALELVGLDATDPLDVVSPIATATAQSISTAATNGTYYDTIGLALWLAQDATSTSPPTWTTQAGQGWIEQAEQGVADASTAIGSMLAAYAPLTSGALPAAAAAASLAASGPLAAVAVKLTAAGSTSDPDLRYFTGFEQGTLAGAGVGVANSRLFETITGSPTISTSTPRTGAYCLELPNTAAAHNLTWPAVVISASTATKIPARVCFRFVGNLPTADTEIASWDLTGSGTAIVLRYRTASGTVAVQVGTGTEQVAATSCQADTWHAVGINYAGFTTTHTCEWRLDDVEQVPATATMAVSTGITMRLGRTSATAPGCLVRLDDCVIAGRRGNYPLGNHRMILLRPDPAAAPTVVGSAANFNVFTSNGTMAAWNAATARDATRELPPVIGATADGFAQVTAATVDYVRVPMETYTLDATQAIRGVRMLACGWAAATQAKTLGFRGYHGADTAGGGDILHSTATDPLFDQSTTAPAWLCKTYTPGAGGGWTQARLDALELFVGFSDDATPDVGVHWLGAEIALATGRIDPVFGGPGDPLRVEAPTDPLTGGIIALWVYTPAEYSAELVYEINGVEQTPVSVPASSDPLEILLRAADMQTISRITLAPVPV